MLTAHTQRHTQTHTQRHTQTHTQRLTDTHRHKRTDTHLHTAVLVALSENSCDGSDMAIIGIPTRSMCDCPLQTPSCLSWPLLVAELGLCRNSSSLTVLPLALDRNPPDLRNFLSHWRFMAHNGGVCVGRRRTDETDSKTRSSDPLSPSIIAHVFLSLQAGRSHLWGVCLL